MTLSIDINDQELTEIVEKGIKNLDEKVVSELAKEALKKYLDDPQVMERLLFEYEKSYSYSYISSPQKWFLNMFANSFNEEEIKEYREKFLNMVNEKQETIIIQTLSDIFSKMLVTDDFRYKIRDAIARMGT